MLIRSLSMLLMTALTLSSGGLLAAADGGRHETQPYLLTQASSDCPLNLARGGAAEVCFLVAPGEIHAQITLTEDSPTREFGGYLASDLEYLGSGVLKTSFCDSFSGDIPPSTSAIRLTIRQGPAAGICQNVPDDARSWALSGHAEATFTT